MNRIYLCAALLAVVTFSVEANVAHAQQVQPAAVAVRREPTYEYVTGPRPKPLRNGLWTLSVMYVTSVVVAVVSPRAADDYLYIPVAGPWMDLAHREKADNGKYETLNKVLLVTDGVVQALGVAQIALSLIFPETRLVQRAAGLEVGTFALHATPLISPRAVGLQAGGTF